MKSDMDQDKQREKNIYAATKKQQKHTELQAVLIRFL